MAIYCATLLVHVLTYKMGQTNILQHKSWHVYNKKNIEKVRKDEEKARQGEKEKAERVMIAEREARLVLLRQRAEQRHIGSRETQTQSTNEESSSQTIEHAEASKPHLQSSGGHINFWEELEQDSMAANKFSKNPEAEAEKKAQDEKWERQITMYLDKGVKEGSPWYSMLKGSESQSRSLEDSVKKEIIRTKDEKTKYREDPLSTVRKYLGQDQGKESHKKSSSDRKGDRGSRHKDKKGHSKSDEDKKDKLQRLREERLARERQERAKTLNVLKKGQNSDQGTDERDPSYRYHSQFNPKATQEAKIRWTDTIAHNKHRHQPY